MNKLFPILLTIAVTLSVAAEPAGGTSAAGEKNFLQQAMEAINDSKILYSVKFLEKPIPLPDRSALLTGFAYQVKTDKGIVYKGFDPQGEAKKLYHAAELDFESHKFAAAREKYKRVMLQDPSQTWMMTFVAQTYGIEKKFNEAESWYKKSIEANYIDYLAHWLLADIYMLKGEKEKAVSEISIAKVLNRNNPKLERKRKEIYAANGLDSSSWTFHPQMRLEKTEPMKVVIEADSVWMYYAVLKAAWEFEPGYREKKMKNAKRADLETLESLEAIILPNLQKDIPLAKRLDKALNAGKLDEFVFFEMVLLDHPFRAFYLDSKEIQSLADYLVFMAKK